MLDTFSAPLHVGKDGKPSGTNDPVVFEEKKKDAEDSYRSCMLRERKKRTEEAEYEKKITKELFNKRTDN